MLPIGEPRVTIVGRADARAADVVAHAAPPLLAHCPGRFPLGETIPAVVAIRRRGGSIANEAHARPPLVAAAPSLLARLPAPLPVTEAVLAIELQAGAQHEPSHYGQQAGSEAEGEETQGEAGMHAAAVLLRVKLRWPVQDVELAGAVADVLVRRLLDVLASAGPHEGERRPAGAVELVVAAAAARAGLDGHTLVPAAEAAAAGPVVQAAHRGPFGRPRGRRGSAAWPALRA
mmetsp:Transcript_87411/g.271843  ORF Transcript_87411/g.271843 Transcript_87411/m.271843 type:complete len:232 (+) Transcript_87411:1682-2377(+)